MNLSHFINHRLKEIRAAGLPTNGEELNRYIEQFRNQNGRLPEKLLELRPQFRFKEAEDPFAGNALRYRRTETGYVLYSVGGDGRDDGGLVESERKESSDGKSYDLSFTVER